MSTISLSKDWSYDRTMRLLGSLWFLLLALVMAAKTGTSLAGPWPALLSSFCLACFYLLLSVLIMARGPAKARAEGVWPRMVAFVGTYLPWTIAFCGKTDLAVPNLISSVLVLTGLIMMLVTIRHLGRSFSIVPQARSVVQTGPYRWIKHPLYLVEELVVIGAVLQSLTPAAVIIFILHGGFQVSRMLYEEDVLRRTCPEYADYEASRWRLIPHIW
jgi:protein-S-isoprenylcysteine O-methyltransferase Ste14